MGSRIITLQRQARELGRLRTGYTDTSGTRPRPVRSTTWIATSHSAEYCEAAAGIWGGTVEKWKPLGAGAEQYRVITDAPAIDAILPPGDPLAQYYEAWSRSGCARRCDGETELLSDSSCLCVQDWGQDWHKVAGPRDGACQMTTRLGVILPDMPDMGAWRVETHSYYSASEIAAAVDLLKGQLGTAAMVPVRLRIEPRTRVSGGKTKQFPVVTLGLRGATAGQVMSGQIPTAEVAAPAGQAPAVGAADTPAELPAAPARDWLADLQQLTTADEVRALYRECAQAGQMTADLSHAMKEHADLMAQAARGSYRPDADRRPEAEMPTDETPAPAPVPVDEGAQVDGLWMQCMSATPDDWSTQDLVEAYAARHGGELPDDATAALLTGFLKAIKAGQVAKPGEQAPAESGDAVPF
ncbi:hypothetical protein BJF83_17475 [Nocardiopsis sp. CNR-923]|uniref:recombination directionality factor n=1 Tax=Nocardiopsis sp. CNR-923 TaxID=1904965 RepID=UPI000958F11E|nr:hypothetical protein [Nocardiopsis sp. CNR-923]OLT27774.1 hypothetical protein BJF83_17475 [Nocardiopsis sp. CNR-923]